MAKRERMEFPAWTRIVVDLPLSSIYYRSSPLYRTHSSDGRTACFPNPLTRTFFRCFNELSLLINPGTTQSFSVPHHHTWGLRGASRGRDKPSSCIFRGDSAFNSLDSVSGDTVLRRQGLICLEFLRFGNDP
jgi:hypothetical protein